MEWRPNTESIQPIYWQIYDYFQKEIINGKLRPGDLLPTERKLAAMLNVNRSTIKTAYDELRAAGLAHSVQGSGTRVSENHWDVSPVHSPDWERYTVKRSFRPSQAMIQRLRDASELKDVIDFSRGELSTDLLPLDEIKRTLTSFDPCCFGYGKPLGEHSLREVIADHLRKTEGLRISYENVLITSGEHQALYLITQWLLNPGDAVGLEQPSYAYSLPLFTLAGLRLCRIPTDEHGLIPEEVRTLHHRHRIRMIFANPTLQNPTGTILPEGRRKRLLEICEELRIPIVEVDSYAGLSIMAGRTPPTLKAMYEPGGLLIYLGSLSNTVAPPFRVGWLVGPPKVIKRLADAKEQMGISINAVVQSLAERFLTSEQWSIHVGHVRTAMRSRRDAMCAALQKYAGPYCRWTVPDGGYHLWCKLFGTVYDKEVLEAGIQQGVLITPGSVYGADDGFVRLSYIGQPPERIDEGTRRFGIALATLLKKVYPQVRT